MDSLANQRFQQNIELHSAALKKELRLADLVAIQILNVVGFSWIGIAGKLGSSHVIFWLPAVVLFYIPSGIVIAYLAKEMPLEGGLYQWAKLRFGPLAGFLVAMNIWVYNLLQVSVISVLVLGMAPYALEPGSAWLARSKPAILAMSLGVTCCLMFVAWRGLAIGKRVNNFGGLSYVLLFVAVILVALPHWFRGAVKGAPVGFTFPAVSILNLNILGKMGFGALSGVDAAAVFAGECQKGDAGGAIRRAVWLAAPIVALMMILGTASVLAFSRPESIDLVAPGIQALSVGAPALVQLAAVLFAATLLAGGSLSFNLMIRFPMVAGWDHLLPEWFSRLDSRYRTPVGSVLLSGFASLVFAFLATVGAGIQEAFQFLTNASLISYACAYLVMFAIPLTALGAKPSLNVRVAALSGSLMTLLFVVLSVFPIVEVEKPGLFTVKIVAMVGGLQGVGAVFYIWAIRSRAVSSRRANPG